MKKYFQWFCTLQLALSCLIWRSIQKSFFGSFTCLRSVIAYFYLIFKVLGCQQHSCSLNVANTFGEGSMCKRVGFCHSSLAEVRTGEAVQESSCEANKLTTSDITRRKITAIKMTPMPHFYNSSQDVDLKDTYTSDAHSCHFKKE